MYLNKSIQLIIFYFIFWASATKGVAKEQSAITLQLEAALNLAIEESRKLNQMAAQIHKCEIGLAASRSAFNLRVIPKGDTGYIGGGKTGSGLTLGGGLNIEKKFPFGTQININPFILKAAKEFQSKVQVRVSQPIFKHEKKELNAILNAQFRWRSAYRAYTLTAMQIAMHTIEKYYEVIKQQLVLDYNREFYQELKLFYEKLKIKEKFGIIDFSEAWRAELEMQQALETLKRSEETSLEALDALRIITNVPMDTPIIIEPLFETILEEIDEEQAIVLALENRIELEQSYDQILESKRFAKISKLNQLPRIDFVADYSNVGYGEEFTGAFGRKRDSTWGIGLVATPACNQEPRIAEIHSGCEIVAAKKEYCEIRNSILYEVKHALRNLEQAKEKVSLQEKKMKQYLIEMNLASLKSSYLIGDQFSMLQAYKLWLNSKTHLKLTQIEKILVEYHLYYILGILIKQDNECF